MLAVIGFELRVAVDRNHVEVEGDVRLNLAYDLERTCTERAPVGRVHHDAFYG